VHYQLTEKESLHLQQLLTAQQEYCPTRRLMRGKLWHLYFGVLKLSRLKIQSQDRR
jgi:hypothetical protein